MVRSTRYVLLTRLRAACALTCPRIDFLPPQVSTIRLCDALFAFHLAEYRLLYNYRYRAKDQVVNVDVPSDLTIAFCGCVDAAVGLANVFQNHFVRPGYLPFCFNLAYVALAICSIWLVKNIATMSQSDRERVVRTLSDIQVAVEAASRSSDDMPAYMHRLLTHLLTTLSPATQLSSLAASQNASTSMQTIPQDAQDYPSSGSNSSWSLSSAQQIIQDNLHHHHAHTTLPPQQEQQAFASTSAATLPQQEQTEASVFAALDALPMHEDMLFPAADDDIWCVSTHTWYAETLTSSCAQAAALPHHRRYSDAVRRRCAFRDAWGREEMATTKRESEKSDE